MTQHIDLLLTLACVFVAFAGFAGLIASCGHSRAAPDTAAYHAQLVVGVALLALSASLLPLVLDAARLPTQGVTRLSASFFASGAIAIGAWAWQRLRARQTSELRSTRVAAAVGHTLVAALVIALFVVGAGFLAAQAAAIYLIALLACMALCALHFSMLVLAIDLGGRG